MSAYAAATLWLLAKALVGIAVFIAVLAVGQLLDGRAAGMMVTFPTLNGMGLLAASDLDRVANELFPIIALNGLLCAACILIYRRCSLLRAHPRMWAAMPYVALLVWGAALVLALRIGEAVGSAVAMTAAYAVITVVLTAATLLLSRPAARDATGRPMSSAHDFWRANRHRIVLFAGSLAAVLMAAEFWQGALGWLAALPLVPLFGLAGIAEERPHRLDEMKDTILIGPLLSMIFVLLVWHYLSALRAYVTGAELAVYSALICLAGWGGCVAVTLAPALWRRFASDKVQG